MVKFFIDSNVALEALKSKSLRKVLDLKIGKHHFEKVILPDIDRYVHNKIEEKLQAASYVTLLTDIWSNKALKSYIALGANLVNANFEDELIIISIYKMECTHTADNIKNLIELLVNKYKFDKKKLNGIVTDEGSNLLKLFKQLESEFCMFIDPLNEEEDEDYVYVEEDEDEDEEDDDDDDENEDVDLNEENIDSSDEISTIINTLPTKQDILNVSKDTQFINATRQPEDLNDLNYDESTEYDLNRGEIIENLELKLESNVIPRFSCSAHKMNLAVRKAINATPHISNLLSRLSNFIKDVRKKIDQSA